MSNRTASISVSLSYVGPGGNTRTEPAQNVTVPFNAQNSGEIDIPDGATAGSSHAIPFGSVAKATAALVRNNTSQDLVLKCGGATAHALAPGGMKLVAGPTASGATGALTAITVEPTATQSGVERVAYWVFGDPS